MVKSHNCLVKINNETKSDMTFVGDWYEHGRLGDGFPWPAVIKPGKEASVLSYELDWSWAGCSGYVTYKIFNTDITIAFSNPTVGNNKLGVGTGGKSVWDHMSSNDYERFTLKIESSDGQAIMQFDCQCTDGVTNTCTVDVTAFTK